MKRKLWTLLLALGAALALGVGAGAADFTGWTALMDTHSGRALADGNYYLNSDVTISQTITVSGTVTLDLNGHVLKYKSANKGSVIKVEGGGQLAVEVCTQNFDMSTLTYNTKPGLASVYTVPASLLDGGHHVSVYPMN